ncbi:MAG: hypothetical protein J4N63_11290 [Chloroflexi bacterium]|nr:hypothetical protein [Chloroflexota bacterium]MCI0776348.1 hypothetical protein [Chloroflexota bacterium]MCI0804892.1 hypothetical protein [Chloroflexota bacterium]MCI0809727.1 hypothetical protein [Chloroflexota bacterium]MCI0835397.1 hypothetical protein [Chloroflexota bacterium]
MQDEATMEFLAECEIEYAQGCYIGEPEPFRDLVSPTGIDPTACGLTVRCSTKSRRYSC